MKSTHTGFLALAALVLGLGAGCKPPATAEEEKKPSAEAAPEAEAETATGPVARVNGEELARADFQRQMERTRARFERAGRQIAPALEVRLKENLIRKMIDDELIRQKAKAEGVVVSGDELAQKLEEHKGRFGTEEAFTSFLERTQQSADDVSKDLERNLLRDKLFAKMMEGEEPSDEDAKTYYEENKDRYKQREQVEASHILFKVGKADPSEVKKQKLAKAKEVLALAKKPGADFAALAKEHSEGPTASRGGDLGPFSRGRMVKEFEDVAFAAKPGALLGPVETKFGYHLIKVAKKTPERERPYEEVKESILTSLKARARSKATRDILRTMKEAAKIEVLEPGVDLDRRGRPQPPVQPDGEELATKPEIQRLRERSGLPEASPKRDPARNKAAVEALRKKGRLSPEKLERLKAAQQAEQ